MNVRDTPNEPPPAEVTELRGSEGGLWEVTTIRSRHLFDLDHNTITRVPGPEALPSVNDTTRPIREIKVCAVGQRGYWLLEPDRDDLEFYWQAIGVILRIARLPDNSEPGPASSETHHVIIGQDSSDD